MFKVWGLGSVGLGPVVVLVCLVWGLGWGLLLGLGSGVGPS